MNKTKAPILIALTMVLVASACLVTLPAPASSPATLTPDLAMTGKARALTNAPSAAPTMTAIPPTDAPTTTLTPFPSITALPTPTSTSTKTPFGYFETPTPTPTVFETPDPAEGATNDWGSDFRCSIVTKSPSNWTVERESYQASWTLLNSGHKTWQASDIRLTFVEGAKVIHGHDKVFRLTKDVRPGQTITLKVEIYLPSEAGNYRSVWGLYSYKINQMFCTFTTKAMVLNP